MRVAWLLFIDKKPTEADKSNKPQLESEAPALSVDLDSFQLLDGRNNVFKDKNHVYYEDKIIEDADPNTFQIFLVTSKYAKDKSNIFWLDKRYPTTFNADINTFEVDVENPKWAKNQYSVFYKGYKQWELDAKSLKILGENHVQDHANIYFIDKDFPRPKPIVGADINTFSIIDNKEFEGINAYRREQRFAKDRLHIYYRESIIDQADPATFKVLGEYGNFAIDKKNVFIKKDDVYQILKNADRESFTLTQRGSDAEDKNFLYSSKGKITSKDEIVNCNCSSKKTPANNKSEDQFIQLKFKGKYPDKYTPDETENWIFRDFHSPYKYSRTGIDEITTQYWKNSKSITYQKNHLPNVDVKNFEVIDLEFGKDNQNVYYQDQLIEGADIESFVVLDSGYSRDKNQLFYHQNKVTNLTKENYTEKPYRHYYGGNLLKRVYSDELEIYHKLPYAKIGSQIFYEEHRIKDIDSTSFHPLRIFTKNGTHYPNGDLSKFYSRDENYVYYKTEKLEDADPNSFTVTFEQNSGPNYMRIPLGKDSAFCYQADRKIDCP